MRETIQNPAQASGQTIESGLGGSVDSVLERIQNDFPGVKPEDLSEEEKAAGSLGLSELGSPLRVNQARRHTAAMINKERANVGGGDPDRLRELSQKWHDLARREFELRSEG